MVTTIAPSETFTPGTETQWKSVWTELLGAEVRMITGKRFTHRAIVAGSGDPLILVHGVGGHAEVWARNVMNLAKHYKVYAIDALFHGYSTREPYEGDRRALRQAEGVVDLLDAEGLKWAHYEGESMGSAIGFELGYHFPERCGKLVLNTGAYFIKFDRTFVERSGGGNTLNDLSQASITDPTMETVRKRMEWLVTTPDRLTDEVVDIRYKMYTDPEIKASMLRVYNVTAPSPKQRLLYTEDDVRKMAVPSLVYWTENNPGSGCDVGEAFAELLPNAEFYCMPDAAHWPQWEHPAEHDRVVLEFLGR